MASSSGQTPGLVSTAVKAIFWKPLPSLVFGVCSTVSGLLYSTLPETLGQVLPDTIEQATELRHQVDNRKRRHKRDERANNKDTPASSRWSAFDVVVVEESDTVQERTTTSDVIQDTRM